jgi:UDP-N-acetylmuramate dehydrogenase
MTDALLTELRRALPGLEARREEPLRNFTSFGIGGPAELLLLPSSGEELAELCALLRGLGVKPVLLGNGSNVLAPDEGLRGAVVVTRRAAKMERRGDGIAADCGASLTKLAAFALEEGLTGLEFAYGIPGTLGGALIMNAGAYGGEMKDVTLRAEYLDGELRHHTAVGEELDFRYRHSRFGPEDVVLRAELRLQPGEREAIRLRCRELTEKRRASQPLELPSAGSAFKRPPSGYAAAMIDQAGLKGYTVGGAQVSEKHAGFVVNRGGATAADVRKLLEDVQKAVLDRTGVLLEPEIKML